VFPFGVYTTYLGRKEGWILKVSGFSPSMEANGWWTIITLGVHSTNVAAALGGLVPAYNKSGPEATHCNGKKNFQTEFAEKLKQ
jgi:hypothetical protein